MAEKSEIISSLGEQKLLLPALLGRRWRQTTGPSTTSRCCRQRAATPTIAAPHQRFAPGASRHRIDDASLDAVVASSARVGKDATPFTVRRASASRW